MTDVTTSRPPTWVRQNRTPGWHCMPVAPAVHAFHRSLPGYVPTPLVNLPALADELGVGRVLAKDESNRLGLPAFKALGASWAVHRVLDEESGEPRVRLVAATDGNHGRAVARFAQARGHDVEIYVPTAVSPVAVQAIVDEGAAVTVVDGSYDEAVATALRAAEAPDAVLVQDTAWPGYETIPGWIIEGYDTLFTEVDDQLADLGREGVDLVVVPTGVGSLLQAALTHYRSETAPAGTAVVSVEPEVAACVAASLAAGRPVSVETSPTSMAGLNCGTPSSLAWPLIRQGLDAAITVTEIADIQAAHDLRALGVRAGPCGAAPLAAVRAAFTGTGSEQRRAHLGIDAGSTVVLLVTEGDDSNPVPSIPGLTNTAETNERAGGRGTRSREDAER